MCTVTFIPANGKFYFASLRDENPERYRAIAPLITYTNDSCYVAPTDPVGGGTWAGVNELGNVIILLNGGFTNHIKKNNYSLSRGIIVTTLLAAVMPIAEWGLMDLTTIEPFTLIVWSDEKLVQLVWDGQKKHKIDVSKTEAHIWSSATLYNDEAKKYRVKLFHQWTLTQKAISKSSLLTFYKSFADIYNGFLINRNEKIKTLSYTFITLQTDKNATMAYYDFFTQMQYDTSISLLVKEENCLSPFN